MLYAFSRRRSPLEIAAEQLKAAIAKKKKALEELEEAIEKELDAVDTLVKLEGISHLRGPIIKQMTNKIRLAIHKQESMIQTLKKTIEDLESISDQLSSQITE